ncbi:MAG TPA: DUF1801 domain-containing protein, partial [Polyangiaceae bacterium]|nr:DUF1801 domain-containing protein [Polyangiaceae bacterium]
APAKKAPAKKAPAKKAPAKKAPADASASALIDGRIEALGDWRGATLAQIRRLIKEVEPAVVEAWKWRGVPVWYSNGILCTGESYKSAVKVTFAKGAALNDPAHLFNSSLEGNTRRAIDFHEGDKLDEKALKALLRAAVALNKTKPAR